MTGRRRTSWRARHPGSGSRVSSSPAWVSALQLAWRQSQAGMPVVGPFLTTCVCGPTRRPMHRTVMPPSWLTRDLAAEDDGLDWVRWEARQYGLRSEEEKLEVVLRKLKYKERVYLKCFSYAKDRGAQRRPLCRRRSPAYVSCICRTQQPVRGCAPCSARFQAGILLSLAASQETMTRCTLGTRLGRKKPSSLIACWSPRGGLCGSTVTRIIFGQRPAQPSIKAPASWPGCVSLFCCLYSLLLGWRDRGMASTISFTSHAL